MAHFTPTCNRPLFWR